MISWLAAPRSTSDEIGQHLLIADDVIGGNVVETAGIGKQAMEEGSPGAVVTHDEDRDGKWCS